MKAIEVLKILKNNIDKAADEGANYAIETIDIELIDRALSLHNVVGRSEQLVCPACGDGNYYYINDDGHKVCKRHRRYLVRAK